MLRFLCFIAILLTSPLATAQEALPDARVIVSRDVDYPGGDLFARRVD